jgi:hypothetical protein
MRTIDAPRDHALLRGVVAGTLGTAALNATTYADIALRGRPPSSVPDEVVRKTVEERGIPLSSEGPDSDAAAARRTGLGALSGYATGIAGGVAYALVRRRTGRVPLPVAGLLAGTAVMAATDAGSTAAGVTDPRRWGLSGWLADIVPHAAYGLVTAVAFDRLRPVRGRRR